MSYVIITDSCANLTDEMIEKNNISIIPLSFHVNGEEYKSYEKGKKSDLKKFYNMMRQKESITTSLVSPDQFTQFFTEYLEAGQDILYIGFSSGLSGTYQSSVIAAEELKEKYPDRKIITVDSLCASAGQGLLVYHVCMLKEAGKSLEEVGDWAMENRFRSCHWFTCDDLFFLKRGGRISASSAVLGSLLQVKPVMHVTDEGKLAVFSKARGRKQAMQSLVKHMEETVENPEEQVVIIAHGDCEDEALAIKKMVEEKFTVKEVIVTYLDPVIGAHAGPGTLALFYMGTNRA
ncbi:MAG: DegV family protein [Ruminococcaceae bacterium]|nr:DegV family protein [Oscillospiraceae bacterium]